MEIVYSGQYDRQMFTQGSKLVERSSLIQRILRWLSLILSITFVAVGIYNWLAQGVTTYEVSRLIRHFITALLLVSYYVSPHVSRWKNISRLFQERTKRTVQGTVTLEGITIESGSSPAANIRWDQFFRKGRKDNLLTLLTLSGSLTIFHRNFFRNESDWQRFLQLVNQKVVEPK